MAGVQATADFKAPFIAPILASNRLDRVRIRRHTCSRMINCQMQRKFWRKVFHFFCCTAIRTVRRNICWTADNLLQNRSFDRLRQHCNIAFRQNFIHIPAVSLVCIDVKSHTMRRLVHSLVKKCSSARIKSLVVV